MEKWQDLQDMLETMLLWLIIWLNLQAGKMKQILFLWLATRARKLQAHPTHSGSPILVLQEQVIFWPYNESCIDLACLIKMAGYWPYFFVSFFTDLTFVSVHNNINKNLINFQPSWSDMQGQSQHPICSQFASPSMYGLAPFYLMIFHQWN